MKGGDQGLTLLELVAAMALFALVAVMGLQALSGTLRSRERLDAIADETAGLNDALALLRGDMTAVVPMFFYPPEAAPLSAVWQGGNGAVIALSLAGQPDIVPRVTDRHRVEWRYDAAEGTLTRAHWPTLLPARADQITDPVQVLEGVSGLSLRTYWAGAGWVEGHFAPAGVALAAAPPEDQDIGAAAVPPAAYFSGLPLALEITVETQKWGPLPLVQVLQ